MKTAVKTVNSLLSNQEIKSYTNENGLPCISVSFRGSQLQATSFESFDKRNEVFELMVTKFKKTLTLKKG